MEAITGALRFFTATSPPSIDGPAETVDTAGLKAYLGDLTDAQIIECAQCLAYECEDSKTVAPYEVSILSAYLMAETTKRALTPA